MKRFSQRGGHSVMTELNVTPLLDLAFVLLIIFIITTPLMENSVDVHLPTSKTSHNAVDPKAVKTITIDKAGALYLEKNRLSPRQLDASLLALKQQDPEVAIVIRADRDLRYQQLVDVFNALQRAQITKMGLLNTPEH
jgi:biopolymer transport protein ExbD